MNDHGPEPGIAKSPRVSGVVRGLVQRFRFPDNERTLMGILVVLAAVIAGALIVYATPWGPWAFSDSVEYVEIARNLLAGRGLVIVQASGDIVPLTLHPPFYSIMLASVGVGGVDVVVAARWLNVAWFSLLILVAGMTTLRWSGQTWAPLAVSVVWLFSPALIENYTGAITEPLFITMSILSLSLLVDYLQTRRLNRLVLSAVLAGLTPITRYIGLAVFASAWLALLLLDVNPWRKKLKPLLIYGGLGAVPGMLWLIHRLRQAPFPPGDTSQLLAFWQALEPFRISLLETLWSWLPLPSSIRFQPYPFQRNVIVALALVLLALIVGAFWLRRRQGIRVFLTDASVQWTLVLLMTGSVLAAFIGLAHVFGPWYFRLEERQFSPIYPLLVGGGLLAINLLAVSAWTKKIVIALQVVLTVALCWSSFPRTSELLQDLHSRGRGYTGVTWQNASLMRAVMEIPADIAIISNDSEAILFYTHRPAFRLPEIQNDIPEAIDAPFGSRVEDYLHLLFSQGRAALVIFDASNGRLEKIYGSDYPKRVEGMLRGLIVDVAAPEGAIYYYAPADP